jgi:hypothetical protein
MSSLFEPARRRTFGELPKRYEKQREGLGEDYVFEVDNAIRRIEANPGCVASYWAAVLDLCREQSRAH